MPQIRDSGTWILKRKTLTPNVRTRALTPLIRFYPVNQQALLHLYQECCYMIVTKVGFIGRATGVPLHSSNKYVLSMQDILWPKSHVKPYQNQEPYPYNHQTRSG